MHWCAAGFQFRLSEERCHREYFFREIWVGLIEFLGLCLQVFVVEFYFLAVFEIMAFFAFSADQGDACFWISGENGEVYGGGGGVEI